MRVSTSKVKAESYITPLKDVFTYNKEHVSMLVELFQRKCKID
jgi:hypothetical protein